MFVTHPVRCFAFSHSFVDSDIVTIVKWQLFGCAAHNNVRPDRAICRCSSRPRPPLARLIDCPSSGRPEANSQPLPIPLAAPAGWLVAGHKIEIEFERWVTLRPAPRAGERRLPCVRRGQPSVCPAAASDRDRDGYRWLPTADSLHSLAFVCHILLLATQRLRSGNGAHSAV
jgi:hypothetical protein